MYRSNPPAVTIKLLSGTIRPCLPSCQTCRNASNTMTFVGGKWWKEALVKKPFCWNSFKKFRSNRHTESSCQFSTWFILIRSAIYDFCQIIAFLSHANWITSDYLLFVFDIATAWRTSDISTTAFFFHVLKNTSLRIHCPFTKSIRHFCFKEEVLVGRRLLVSYYCHFLEKYTLRVCGREMAGNQQGGGEGQTPRKGKKTYRQSVSKTQTDKSLQCKRS